MITEGNLAAAGIILGNRQVCTWVQRVVFGISIVGSCTAMLITIVSEKQNV